MREPPAIAQERLRACLRDQYDLLPLTVDFLPLGLDFQAGVYRVVSEQGEPFLLKATSRPLYKPQYLVPRYLKDQGVTFVVAPIPTRDGLLWAHLEKWVIIVYPFLNGETSWTRMTDEQWKEVGSTFRQIHQTELPSSDFEPLRKETFDPQEYLRGVQTCEARMIQGQEEASASRRAMRSAWLAHQATIHASLAALTLLGDELRGRALSYVVCHADLHPANLLRTSDGHVHVIDWDEVMLAPKERDFLFVGMPSQAAETEFEVPPFFQGYGRVDIDRVALAYYLYERVIQDAIVCAQDVFFRDDLSEESREDCVQLFQSIWAEDGEFALVSQAALHLPTELVPRRPETPA